MDREKKKTKKVNTLFSIVLFPCWNDGGQPTCRWNAQQIKKQNRTNKFLCTPCIHVLSFLVPCGLRKFIVESSYVDAEHGGPGLFALVI